MKTVQTIVNEINEAGICSPHWVEDEIDMDDAEEVATVDRDEHRWYVIGTVVYKLGDAFFGVCGPISLKSESMGFDDVEVGCTAFEMEAIPSVSYRRKKQL